MTNKIISNSEEITDEFIDFIKKIGDEFIKFSVEICGKDTKAINDFMLKLLVSLNATLLSTISLDGIPRNGENPFNIKELEKLSKNLYLETMNFIKDIMIQTN